MSTALEMSFVGRVAELSRRLAATHLLPLLPAPGWSGPIGLGLLTANAQFDPTVPSLDGVRDGRGCLIAGRIRIGDVDAAGTLAPVRLDGETRLCLLAHGMPGLRITGRAAAAAPAWLVLDAYRVPAGRISEPLNVPGDARIVQALDGLALGFAEAVAEGCGAGLRALRRDLAAAQFPNGVASQSQLVAHEISKLEIETWLVGAAASRGEATDPWPLLCAADAVARAFVNLVEDLDGELGLGFADRAGPWPRRGDLGHLGGSRAIQGEDARRCRLDLAGCGPR